jgi:prolipoprotein diacylglyceryltransferase
MLPILNIGPLALQTPGLVLLFGLWLGLSWSERLAAERKNNADALYNLVMLGLIAGIVGGRLSFVGQNFATFAQNPTNLLSLNPGLFDPLGGAVVALLAMWVYGQRKALPFWATLDMLVPFAGVMVIAIALANLASGRGFGLTTDLPWAIDLWGADRHPTQIYDGIAALAVILGLWWRRNALHPAGMLFLIFAALTSATHLFLLGFRADSVTLANGMRVAQWAAWGVLALSLWGISQRRERVSST